MTSKKKRAKLSILPSPNSEIEISPLSLSFSLFILFVLKRKLSNVPLAAIFVSWLMFQKRDTMWISLCSLSTSWPPLPNNADPSQPIPLPLYLRFLDVFPSYTRSFPGIPNARVLPTPKKQLTAWLVECNTPQPQPTVICFKSPFSHRGQYLRCMLYRVLTTKLDLNIVTYDNVERNHIPRITERALLKEAHTIYTAASSSNEHILWGTSLFGSYTAATLCLYLMRRGTPPACLILENPVLRLPSPLPFTEEFDLEARIRAICTFEECRAPPILFICSERERFTAPKEHCHRLAAIASAMSASQRVFLLSLDVNLLDMYRHARFVSVVRGFVHSAVRDASRFVGAFARQGRGYSVDFGFDAFRHKEEGDDVVGALLDV